MKQIFLLLTSSLCVIANAQPSISPDIYNEFCPNSVITFAVTLAGSSPAVVPKALNAAPSVVRQAYNIQTSSGVTTFNFDGRFIDVNNKQTFQVNYKYGPSNRDTTKDFTFIKIKSLTLLGDGSSNDCSKINPSPASITHLAARQVVSPLVLQTFNTLIHSKTQTEKDAMRLLKFVEVGSGGYVPARVASGDTKSGYTLKASPNPARNNVTISLTPSGSTAKANTYFIQEIRISDKIGGIRKQVSFKNKQLAQTISITDLKPDIYTVSVFDGNLWQNIKLLVQIK